MCKHTSDEDTGRNYMAGVQNKIGNKLKPEEVARTQQSEWIR
jgi:hypothetical protein